MKYKLETGDIKDDELLKQLKEQTEAKTIPLSETDFTDTSPGISKPVPGPEIKKEDFISDPSPKVEEKTEQPSSPPISYEEQAQLYINLLDGAQSIFLPGIYFRQKFTQDEADELKSIQAQTEPRTESQTALVRKYEEYKEYLDTLPFTPKEEKILKGPLAQVLEKYQHTPGPESALIMAALIVAAPRAIPLFNFS